MKITLKDGCPRKKGEAVITVSKNGNMLEIKAEGYGEHGAAAGEGSVIVIEHYDGSLRAMVFSDINTDGPTDVIGLEGARESARWPVKTANETSIEMFGTRHDPEPPAGPIVGTAGPVERPKSPAAEQVSQRTKEALAKKKAKEAPSEPAKAPEPAPAPTAQAASSEPTDDDLAAFDAA